MKNLLEDIKLSKISYLVEKLEKRNVNEKVKVFKKLEKEKITKNIGLYLIENSTRDFGIDDDFGGINSSLIELCFKDYYAEYTEAINNIFKDLPVKAQDRVLYLLTTRNELEPLQLYADLVLKYYKKRDNIPIGELINKPLAYPYVFPQLYKALKFDTEKNNIIILLNQYLSSGVVLKEDLKKNKKVITDSICKLFDKALKFKFKDTYEGLNNKKYRELRYYLELAVNIEFHVSSKKTKDYLAKLLKKNDNQLKLFILDNYIRKNEKLTKFNFDPIIKDKSSFYALYELLTIYDKLNLLKKKKIEQKDLAKSDLYTNFVIATSYSSEPKNLRFQKVYTKGNYDYYIYKFDYKYKYNASSSDYLTNYICSQLGIDKHNGEDITNKFVGISGGYRKNDELAIINKKHNKLLISKIEKDDNIDDLVEKLIAEDELKEIKKEVKEQEEKEIKEEKTKKENKLNLPFKKKEKEQKQKKEKKPLFSFKKKNIEEIKEEIVEPLTSEEKERKNYHIFSYILLFLFAVFIGLLIYCMLYIYGVGSINDGINEEIIKPTKLDDKGNFTEIMGSEIFNQTEGEYFVLLFKESKKEKSKYYRYINEYNKREFRFYYVDLKNNENKFLYLPNNLDFVIYTDRLLKVKDKEFEYYVDGKTNILNEMQAQIEEIIKKEKEAEKQALKERKKEQLENIAISMADNKKDKRPVTRTLFKAAKKQEEINKYALKNDTMIEVKKIELDLSDTKVEEVPKENIKVLAVNKKAKKSNKKKINNEDRLLTYELRNNNTLDFKIIKVKDTSNTKVLVKKDNKKTTVKKSKKKIKKKVNNEVKLLTYELKNSNTLDFTITKVKNDTNTKVIAKNETKKNQKRNVTHSKKKITKYELKTTYNLKEELKEIISNKIINTTLAKNDINKKNNRGNSIVIYRLKSSNELTLK